MQDSFDSDLDTTGDDSTTPASSVKRTRRSSVTTLLVAAIVIAFIAVGAVAYLVITAIPREGEAPTTAAQAAINAAMEDVSADPSSVYARLTLADAYFQYELWEDALGALDDARSLEPTGAMAAFVEVGYGRVYEGMGDVASAREHYLDSLDYEASFDANYALGNLASVEGDDAAAVDYWLQALEMRPGAATLRVDVAVAYEAQGEYELALEQLDEALRYIPDDPDILAVRERIQAKVSQ